MTRRVGRADSLVNPSNQTVSSMRGAVVGARVSGDSVVLVSDLKSPIYSVIRSVLRFVLLALLFLFLDASNQFGESLESFLKRCGPLLFVVHFQPVPGSDHYDFVSDPGHFNEHSGEGDSPVCVHLDTFGKSEQCGVKSGSFFRGCQ